jgi:hypothetical protein
MGKNIMSQNTIPMPQQEDKSATSNNVLEILKHSFEDVVPSEDARTAINPLSFIVTLVFCYLGDSKTFSLESVRRFMMAALEQSISRSAFWERLAGNRLRHYLHLVLAKLMIGFATSLSIGGQLLTQMGVTSILLHDSSAIMLLPRAKDNFPGTFTDAGIKWHATFDLLKGTLIWFQLTPGSTHDRKCFPPLEMLKGVLIIFDLGYWDYGLLYAIDKAEGFFLSRVKSGAVIYIKEVIQGLPKKVAGKSLFSLNLSNSNGSIIEVIMHKLHDGHSLNYRVIGFWNPITKEHHWYITNLLIAAHLIYPLYRLRWQIELIFKACKSSLNANQITSGDKNIIESLLLASIIAHLSTYTIFSIGTEQMAEEQQWAVSFQRIAKVAVLLAREFILFLLNSSQEHIDTLMRKIRSLADELYDPNYKKRESSVARVNRLLLEGG